MLNENRLQKLAAAGQSGKERDYWLKQLAGFPGRSRFPDDCQGNTGTRELSPAYRQFKFVLADKLYGRLREMSAGSDYTLNLVLTAGLSVLIYKYTGARDLILGAPIYRQEQEGDFTNTILVLRMRLQPGISFRELLLRARTTISEAVENQDYPLDMLADNMKGDRELPGDGDSPLFETGILLENIHDKSYLRHISYRMLFSFARTAGALSGTVEYDSRHYQPETVQRIALHLERLLQAAVFNVDSRVESLEILSAGEKHRLLVEFNRSGNSARSESTGISGYTPAGQPGTKTIPQWFEEQVEKTPDQIAVELDDQQLSYDELNERANRLALALKRKNAGPDRIIGLMAGPSPEAITGITGILKAGAAYLAIDPAYPAARISYLLKESNVTLLLTDEQSVRSLNFTGLQNLRPGGDQIVVTPPRAAIKDIDRLPFPDRTLVSYKKYHPHISNAPAKNTISLLSSRGCPYHCRYCHKIWPKQHVARSAGNIFQEICYSYEAGIRRFVFLDDIFNFHLENSSRLLEMLIDQRMDVRLFFPNGLRSDRLTREYIDLLARAGTVNIDLALESASPRIQKLIGKNLDLGKFRENISYLLETYPQIILELEMMLGFPSESEEEALSTYALLKELKWVHFPNLNILKIYPNTEISRMAIENGISQELIDRSSSMAYHEIPETLPFPREFVLQYQARFFNEYFLSKERLLQVLPAQMKVLTQDELVKKYNSYLPVEINSFDDLLEFLGISFAEPGNVEFFREDAAAAPEYDQKIKQYFPVKKENPQALRILLIDGTQFFSAEAGGMLYDVIQPPLGLMYLLSYLNQQWGDRVSGKIIKSRIDFASFPELKKIIDGFQPQLIGIRTLSFYKNLFHKTVSLLKSWYPDIPVITGGPYSSSEYASILSDRNVDAAVLGEGEITFAELIGKILQNQGKFPPEEVLKEIPGIAFRPRPPAAARADLAGTREILFLNRFFPGHSQAEKTANPGKINHPGDLAYVLYTSGSTGKPKGVAMAHRSLSNLLAWQLREPELSKPATTLQFASFCFDVSFQEIFSTLGTGGKLVLLGQKLKQNLSAWLPLIREKKIRRLFLPFTVLQQFALAAAGSWESLSSLREIITAGEQLQVTPAIARLLQELKNARLHNHYGPTETHVVTAFTLDGPAGQGPVFPPIGKPIPQVRMRILDPCRRLVPVKVAGELCIGGAALARGYLNHPELTAEKFVPDPFSGPGGLYRTGDLACWLPDGQIEFLGRLDHQVKIRGFRVETGEIENVLLKHSHVNEAAVAVKTDRNGDKYLCAYFVSGHELPVPGLRQYLAATLPHYMIPAYFVQLDRIPLTHSGKVHRQALPEPLPGNSGQFAPPRNEPEKKLSQIWSEVLGIEQNRLGIDSNFFELGGHSLKAATLMAKIHKELGVRIPLEELFKNPTIKNLGPVIAAAETGGEDTEPGPLEKKEFYELSFNQERLWLLHQLAPASTSFNMPGRISFDHEVDRDLLQEVLTKILARHESFRTGFREVDNQPVQFILGKVENPLKVIDISPLAGEARKQGLEELFAREAAVQFDLARPPLFNALLVKLQENEYELLFNMHHIVTDGWSMEILREEFFLLYNGTRDKKDVHLVPLKSRYRDFAARQNRQLSHPGWREPSHRFWKEKLEKGVPLPRIPGNPGARGEYKAGAAYNCMVHGDTANRARQLARENQTTLFVVTFSVYLLWLFRFAGQADIGCTVISAGREQLSSQHIIGFFVNPLLFITRINQEEKFSRLLQNVSRLLLETLQHQDYPLELVFKQLQSRYPEIPVSFNMLNQQAGTADSELAPFAPRHVPRIQDIKFDIEPYLGEYKNGIDIYWTYRKQLYTPEAIAYMAGEYVHLLDFFTKHPHCSYKDFRQGRKKRQFKNQGNQERTAC